MNSLAPELQSAGGIAAAALRTELKSFREFDRATKLDSLHAKDGTAVPVFTNEFWTSRQRAAHSLHEVSYRACFKPQLPRFFIDRLTKPGDLIYDPFMGRGTTLIEASLHGRRSAGCDINPVSRILAEPRLRPVNVAQVAARLALIPLDWNGEVCDDLEVFFHTKTLKELTALRAYLINRGIAGKTDDTDKWIQMVATNRLTGHSPGFFSVYTLPPNQAVSLESQRRINARRNQSPEYRDVKKLILKKTRQLLSDIDSPANPTPVTTTNTPRIFIRSCDNTPELADCSVDLIVTSPPFLDTIDYAADNWLRGWFCGINTATLPIWQCRRLETWIRAMEGVFEELHRVLRPGGFIAFEVGEIRSGSMNLETAVLEIGIRAGLSPELVLINSQTFTKTSNCWGVSNQSKGTNTNRVVLFSKTGEK